VGSAPLVGGEAHYSALIKAAAFVVAADGGLELCLAAGRAPEICVGDFDSVSIQALERAESLGVDLRRHPTSKDESDLDLAVRVARDVGAREVTFTAAFSGRLDHTLASIGTVLGASDLRATVDEPDWSGYVLDVAHRRELVLHAGKGTVLSVMAPAGEATVDLEGTAYQGRDIALDGLSSLGLSNVAILHEQRISITRGQVLVIVNAVGLPLS
jgi:thiamine pyrophosphokinase